VRGFRPWLVVAVTVLIAIGLVGTIASNSAADRHERRRFAGQITNDAWRAYRCSKDFRRSRHHAPLTNHRRRRYIGQETGTPACKGRQWQRRTCLGWRGNKACAALASRVRRGVRTAARPSRSASPAAAGAPCIARRYAEIERRACAAKYERPVRRGPRPLDLWEKTRGGCRKHRAGIGRAVGRMSGQAGSEQQRRKRDRP
jgi:hypothetical protein